MNRRNSSGDTALVEQTFRSAITVHREGKLDEAARLYRAVLKLEDDHFDALNNLGTIRARQASPADAEKLFRRALKRRPESADAHHNLAMALRALNRMEDSARHRDRAAALRASQAAQQSAAAPLKRNLTQALRDAAMHHQNKNLGDAEACYREALVLDPAHFDTLHNLGCLYYQQKRYSEAGPLLERAVRQRPVSAEAHNSLAAAFEATHHYDEAITHYQAALAIVPGKAEVLGNLGNVFITRNRLREAVQVLEEAIARKPDLAAAHNHLGRALEELGDLDAARLAFERAIALAPRQAGFYRCMGDIRKYSAGDHYLTAMEALARDMPKLEEGMQIELHFALGKAYADVGEAERSFRHLLEGNRLKRQEIAYDEAVALQSFERIKETFTAELLRSKAGLGDPSSTPVFILGMPRSGTTLVEQILASHPLVFGAGEILAFDEAVQHLAKSDGVAGGYPTMVATLTAEQLRALGAAYVTAMRAAAPEVARITDKLPANFLLVGLIHLALPNARIIHTLRDPVDTCVSCFSRLFAGSQPHCYNLGELGRHYRAYQGLMAHWRAVLPPGVMLEVQYEEVVADLETQARRLVAHCGLEWNDECLAFHKTQRPVSTSSAAQVRQPIYGSSVGRARAYAHLLQPLYDGLNGDSEAPRAQLVQDIKEALASHAEGKLDEAERRYQAVLDSEREHFDALYNFARLRLQQGKLADAVELYRRAARCRPNGAETHNNLGTVLCMLNRHLEALPHFQQALAVRPDYPEALANLGNACFTLNRLEDAVGYLQRAIALRPGVATVHGDLGRAQHAQGKLDAARLAFETAVTLDPRQPSLYRSLADFKRFTPGDPHVAAMEALAANMGSLSADAQIELHFALGKAYADIERHEASFQQLLEGNRMMRQHVTYDEAGTLESFQRIHAVFTPELMRSKAGQGDPSTRPVFIIGMPRSGTTLIEQILASHPQVWGGGEMECFKEAAARLRGPDGAPGYPEAVPFQTGEQLRALGADYCDAIRAGAPPNALRITDKMPANFLLAGLIPLALPNARIIHISRNPIDTCLSSFSILFLANQPHSYDLAELGRYYRAYQRLMAHWRHVLPPGVMLEVQYEEVVADLAGQARRIVAHCGLDWDETCLDFHRTQRRVWTASSVQVRQPIYRSALGRSEPYRRWLGPLLEALALS